MRISMNFCREFPAVLYLTRLAVSVKISLESFENRYSGIQITECSFFEYSLFFRQFLQKENEMNEK